MRHNSLILYKTIFGWIVSGQPGASKMGSTNTFTIQTREDSSIEQTLRKFWEIEDIHSANKLTPEEIECEEIFVNTHQRRDDGRYVVNLPFKRDANKLGDSLQVATIRFRSLERKLVANPKLRTEYIKQMREYIELGQMVEIPGNYIDSENYYLPHHSVVKESSSTTKIRIVFDGSSKTSNGASLNDQLMVGPTIQPTLWEILLKFRTNKIALVADIEKMYRQVVVSKQHRKFQSVLWRENPEDVLRHYQLTRVTFGLACSSFLAIRTMQQLAVESKEQQDVINNIFQNFYVDDLLTGSDDVEQAIKLKQTLTSVLAKGGFALRKWKSNVSCLSDAPDEVPVSDMCNDKTTTIKTLGIQWHTKSDIFTFKVHAEREGMVNKRKILSETSHCPFKNCFRSCGS